MAAYDIVVGTL